MAADTPIGGTKRGDSMTDRGTQVAKCGNSMNSPHDQVTRECNSAQLGATGHNWAQLGATRFNSASPAFPAALD